MKYFFLSVFRHVNKLGPLEEMKLFQYFLPVEIWRENIQFKQIQKYHFLQFSNIFHFFFSTIYSNCICTPWFIIQTLQGNFSFCISKHFFFFFFFSSILYKIEREINIYISNVIFCDFSFNICRFSSFVWSLISVLNVENVCLLEKDTKRSK